jgi:hypothetical protein
MVVTVALRSGLRVGVLQPVILGKLFARELVFPLSTVRNNRRLLLGEEPLDPPHLRRLVAAVKESNWPMPNHHRRCTGAKQH